MLQGKIYMLHKKGQEEMVGFMMIMILVAIIFLVFLAIFLRSDATDGRADSAELSQFLDSFLEHTTDCASYESNNLNVRRLILRCSEDSGAICANGPATGEKVCDVLKETAEKVIESGWNFGPEDPEKGYVFNIVQESDAGVTNSSLFPLGGWPHKLPAGETCTRFRGAEKLLPNDLVISLRICL